MYVITTIYINIRSFNLVVIKLIKIFVVVFSLAILNMYTLKY